MAIGEIKALPVADVLADDAWVFLWMIENRARRLGGRPLLKTARTESDTEFA